MDCNHVNGFSHCSECCEAESKEVFAELNHLRTAKPSPANDKCSCPSCDERFREPGKPRVARYGWQSGNGTYFWIECTLPIEDIENEEALVMLALRSLKRFAEKHARAEAERKAAKGATIGHNVEGDPMREG